MEVRFRDFDLTEREWEIETRHKLDFSRQDLPTRGEIDDIKDKFDREELEKDAKFEAERRFIFAREHLKDYIFKIGREYHDDHHGGVPQSVVDFHKKRYETAMLLEREGGDIPQESKTRIDEEEFHRPSDWKPKRSVLYSNDNEDEITVNMRNYNGQVSRLDIVSPINMIKYTDQETTQWGRRSTWNLPQVGNCTRCYAYGALGCECVHCNKEWLKYKVGYIMIDDRKTFIGWYFLHMFTRTDRVNGTNTDDGDEPDLQYHERNYMEEGLDPEFEVTALGIYKALRYNGEFLEDVTLGARLEGFDVLLWRRAYALEKVLKTDFEVLQQWNDRSVLSTLEVLKEVSELRSRLMT